MILPYGSTNEDLNRCSEIVREFINKDHLNCTEEQLMLITLEIMNISYSHGGGYNDDVIRRFSEGYFNNIYNLNI